MENASALAHSEDDASVTPQAVNQRAVAAIGATQQSNLAVTTPLAFGNASDLANDLTVSLYMVAKLSCCVCLDCVYEHLPTDNVVKVGVPSVHFFVPRMSVACLSERIWIISLYCF